MNMNTYLSDRQVATRFSVARATIWRWVHTNEFPIPVQLSASCTRWRIEDIDAWAARRPRKRAPRAAEVGARAAPLVGDDSQLLEG
ncbi:MAG TPA: AlpA family phage regulatory protein [Rhizobiales bacterium]|nr:AlpA family phage regulatory protein [Hyphomicrobiales bacterium]